jgi:hypothetical protein
MMEETMMEETKTKESSKDPGEPAAAASEPRKWRKTRGLEEWRTEGYVIEQTDDSPTTMEASGTSTETGEIAYPLGAYTAEPGESPAQLLKRVKGICEEHSLKQQAEPEQRAKLEVGDWDVRVAPSQQLRAELSLKQSANTREIRRLRVRIADSAERHKELKKEAEKDIEDIEDQQSELADQVEHGTTARLRCYRARIGDEWVYYRDPEGTNEIDRQPAADGAQQKLVGDFGTRRPWQDPEHTELVLWLLARDYPPEPKYSWPNCELSWHPLVAALQWRLLGPQLAAEAEAFRRRGAKETDGVRQSRNVLPDRELTKDDFRRTASGAYSTGDPLLPGERYSIDRSRRNDPYKVRFVDVDAEPGPRGPAVQVRHLRGEHRRLKDAIEAASTDNTKRVRWLGDPEASTQLDSSGRYQLQLMEQGDPGQEGWRAELVGLLGQPNDELTVSYVPLGEAKAACQAHKDEEAGP